MSDSKPTRWRSVVLVVALGALLCACGNKGDLRLPEETPPAVDDSG